MSKVACTQCGAMILPRTAAETGGICMACKQGIRASMDASREFYQKLKEYDPHRELWKWLVGKAQADPGLVTLSPAHRHYFAVSLLEGEVYNGGFDQFFTNSSGDYFALASEGLQVLEAEKSLRLLREAANTLFGDELPSDDQQERWDAIGRHALAQGGVDAVAERLEPLDRAFCDEPDALVERLSAFAQRSGILDPFVRSA